MYQLAPYAARDENSKGRVHAEPNAAYRGEFQRDRDRIVHSSGFRRLEYKTQVFVNHEGDMFRTRLTHSIEVAQIARTIARALRLNEDLTEAIALAHDLGHTPFGHAGQDALNACMRDYGGFEHNLQSLRVVDKLEEKYAEFAGLNLMFETREGILKHCARVKAKHLGELGDRFINGGQPSLEAQIANLADEIAYNNHDVDDALRARLLNMEQLRGLAIVEEHHAAVVKTWPKLAERRLTYEVIRRIINHQVVDLITASRGAIEAAAPESIEDVRRSSDSLIQFSQEVLAHHLELKRFLRNNVYRHFRVSRMSRKAGRTIKALFDVFIEDPSILPPDARERISRLEKRESRSGRARGVADYIAGMTDRYAIAEYGRIFDPSSLT